MLFCDASRVDLRQLRRQVGPLLFAAVAAADVPAEISDGVKPAAAPPAFTQTG